MKLLKRILISSIVLALLVTVGIGLALLPMLLAVSFCSKWWLLLYGLYLIGIVALIELDSDGIPSK